MSWATDMKFRLQFFAIIAIVLCPATLAWLAAETRQQIASSSWPSVPGQVEAVNAKHWVDPENNIKYYGRVAYRYVVDGKEYATDLTDLGPGTKRLNRDEALADVGNYRPGMTVIVYYDPADPAVGVLENGIPTDRLIFLVVLGAGTLFGVAGTPFAVCDGLRFFRRMRCERELRQKATPPSTVQLPAVQDVFLGETLEVFRPMIANIVAGFILSLLLVGGGITAIGFPLHAAFLAHWNLPLDAQRGWCWIAVGGLSLTGVVLSVCGVVLAAVSRGLISHRVEICRDGFRYCWHRSVEAIPWSSVHSVRETVLHERPPLLKGPAKLLLPEIASTSYTVFTISGKEYRFDKNCIKSIRRFGELLRENAERHSWPWEVCEEHG